jgi:hypothetical protein
MDPALRVVVQLPLPELWTERGPFTAARERTLGRADVKALLQAGAVQFVVADVGKPLRWVPDKDRFVFWKTEARDHLVEDPHRPIDIDAYPERYAYVASEWVADPLAPARIIVLERHH